MVRKTNKKEHNRKNKNPNLGQSIENQLLDATAKWMVLFFEKFPPMQCSSIDLTNENEIINYLTEKINFCRTVPHLTISFGSMSETITDYIPVNNMIEEVYLETASRKYSKCMHLLYFGMCFPTENLGASLKYM